MSVILDYETYISLVFTSHRFKYCCHDMHSEKIYIIYLNLHVQLSVHQKLSISPNSKSYAPDVFSPRNSCIVNKRLTIINQQGLTFRNTYFWMMPYSWRMCKKAIYFMQITGAHSCHKEIIMCKEMNISCHFFQKDLS